MDNDQCTVAGAPKQYVTLPSETVVPVESRMYVRRREV
jgi:hypothetical protein